MRYHTKFFLLSVAFCEMGNVRGGLVYSCLPIDTDPSAFLCGDIQFYYLDSNINDIYLPYLTLPCLFTLRIVTRVRALYFISTRISKTSTSTYILQQSRQYQTTTSTNIQNNNGLPIHAHRNRSFAGESQRCCMYLSLIPSHPIHSSIHLILTHPVPRLSQFLVLGNSQKSRSTFWN